MPVTALTLTGLASCDTCRKARRWFDQHHIEYACHDVRRDGLSAATLLRWSAAVGWEQLVNRRSQTWRQLAPADREGLDSTTAIALLVKHPTLLKRPVVESPDGTVIVGYDESAYAAL